MAALLNAYARRASPMPTRLYVEPIQARTALKSAVRHLTRPKLVMRWRVASDNRPTASWLSEVSATLKNPDD